MTCAACGRPISPAEHGHVSWWYGPGDLRPVVAHDACLAVFDEIAEEVAR